MKHDKKITIGFLTIITIILILYGCNFILIRKNKVTVNYNNFKEPEQKNNKILFLIERGQKAIENRVNNYFPFYNQINTIQRSIDYNFNKLAYDSVGLNYYPIGKDISNELMFKDDNHFILRNNINNSILDKKINKQIDFFNNVANLNVDTYIYFPSRYEYILDPKMKNYLNYFKKNISKNIKYDELKINTKDDYLKYFYKTDHHWNMYGAYIGYNDILKLMNITPLEGNIVESKDNKYRGSIAKSSYNDSLYDYFTYLDIDLPEHTTLVNNSTDLQKYKSKTIKKTNDVFYDYYVGFYNGNYGEVIHDYNSNNLENLLIIGDSFSWPIDEVIAASFNKTYIINVKYYFKDNKSFNLNEYINKNNISKVLFLYETGSTIFDQFNYGIEKIEVN